MLPMPTRAPARAQWMVVGFLTVGCLVWLGDRVRTPRADEAPCDPFDGTLNFDSTLPLATSWTPFSPLCPPAPNYLALLASNSFTQLSFLRNQTVFLIGDSVDRNALEHFSDMLGRGRWESAFGNATRGAEVAEDWKGKARPFVVEVDELGLIVTNGFLFGLAEDRIDQLFKVYTDQLQTPPTFISFHSGMWDLAYFGRKDRRTDLSSDLPLTPERLEWYRQRLTNTLLHLQRTYPKTPLWIRGIHRVGTSGDSASSDWRGATPSTQHSHNYFTDIRCSQIRGMQRVVAHELGLPMFDFGEVWEGWQEHQDKVHPSIYPGGAAYWLPLLHHLKLLSV